MKKWFSALCTLILFITGGCSPESQKPLKLLLDWWPNPNHVPLYVGIEKGYFTEVGIDIEILKLAEPPNALGYLCSNKADIAIHYFPQVLKAAAKNDTFKMIGILIKEPLQSFLFRDKKGILEPKDLANKALGDCPNGFTAAVLRDFCNRQEIGFREVKRVHFDLVQALLMESVDVVSGVFWNIEPHQLRSLGIETGFFKLKEFGVPPYEELVILTREELLEQDPSLPGKFRSALSKSIAFCKQHPQEAFEIYLLANPGKDAKTRSWEQEAWGTTVNLFADDQEFDSSRLSVFYQWMKEQKLIEKDYDVQKLIR